MIEVEGKQNNHLIVILIDCRSSHSYIDPKLVKSFHSKINKHGRTWLVQLAIRVKRRINELVK